MINVAVIGTGYIGPVHIEALNRIGGVKVKAVTDANLEFAQRTAAKYNIETVYKDGALSVKVKRLMALAIALRLGCTNCILGQTKLALEQGATREEILETISVNVAMSGTTGFAEALRVLKLLDELGIL